MCSNECISVIIPIYNAERTLKRCLDSILLQKYNLFDVLLIDDGSTDSSMDICLNYCKLDSRFRYFNKDNGGVSDARNYGIDRANTKWICFVDADDLVEKEYLYNLMINDEYDFVISGLNVYTGNGVYSIQPKDFKQECISKALFLDSVDKEGFILHGPYQKRFNRLQLNLNNIRFDRSINYGEDTLFVIEYLINVESYQIVSSADYNYYLADSDTLSRQAGYQVRMKYVERFFMLIDRYYKENRLNNDELLVLQRIVQNQLFSCFLFLFEDREFMFSSKKRIKEVESVSKLLTTKYEWFSVRNYNKYYLPVYMNFKCRGQYIFDLLTKALFKIKEARKKN